VGAGEARADHARLARDQAAPGVLLGLVLGL